jgi:hypothetical protein
VENLDLPVRRSYLYVSHHNCRLLILQQENGVR